MTSRKVFLGVLALIVLALSSLLAVKSNSNTVAELGSQSAPLSVSVGRYHSCFYKNKTVTIPEVPSFLIIGAESSGTTSLSTYLKQHPNVIPALNFEGQFFGGMYGNHEFHKDPDLNDEEKMCMAREIYTNKTFDLANITANLQAGNFVTTFERNPAYLNTHWAPYAIRRVCPWFHRVVVLLRNPVDRAFSQYLRDSYRYKSVNLPFEDYVGNELASLLDVMRSEPKQTTAGIASNATNGTSGFEEYWPDAEDFTHQSKKYNFVRKGMYSVQLARWLHYFPRDEILAINFDDFVADTEGVYHRVLDFVGLPKHSLEKYVNPISFNRKKTKTIPNGVRSLLQNFYKPYNAQLEELLGPEWKDVWKDNP